jgi:exopolyphosphatase/guanosine-5'-triphosphate,3'-diphosphate pyrophosphatase
VNARLSRGAIAASALHPAGPDRDGRRPDERGTAIRVAAIDLGTNSTRLLVADVRDGRLEEVDVRTTVTGLGEGVDTRRILLPLPIARVRNVLTEYRRLLEALGAERTLAVGTSAIRDAENGEAFLGEIEWGYGFATELLSGDDEALLTLRGVTAGRTLEPYTLLVDVGGGSTELILGGPEGLEYHMSLDVGSVRMTERFLRSDPPAPRELDACADAVRAVLEEHAGGGALHAIGVAGTITSLAALDLRLEAYDRARVHGHQLSASVVLGKLARLSALTVDERKRIPALDPARAPTIVAGTVIVHEVLRHFALDELEASEHDLLHGVALAAAELPERVEGDAPPGAYTCC